MTIVDLSAGRLSGGQPHPIGTAPATGADRRPAGNAGTSAKELRH